MTYMLGIYQRNQHTSASACALLVPTRPICDVKEQEDAVRVTAGWSVDWLIGVVIVWLVVSSMIGR